MGDAEVEDQAPAARLVSQVVADLHIAAPLACAGRDPVLCANRVSSRAKQRAKDRYHPVVRFGCTSVSCAGGCVVAVKVQKNTAVFSAAGLSKRAVIAAGEGGEHGNLQT